MRPPDLPDPADAARQPAATSSPGADQAAVPLLAVGSSKRSPADRLNLAADRVDDPRQPATGAKVMLDEPGDNDDGREAEPEPRQLHPLPRGLVELYGLLAVLFVLVPEWMATGALFGFREGRRGSELPAPSGAWKRLPELRLASLNLAELRQLARGQGLIAYSRQNRQELTARLLRRLRARR